MLVSTVGPFAKWGAPALRAAVAAGCTYLDSTGEPVFIRRVFEEFGPPAEKSGARLLTAMGYDFAPGALAGALALEEAGEAAVRVDVGYYAIGGGPTSLSSGTRESIVGVTLNDNHAFREGRVRVVRPAERVRSFGVAGKPRDAISVGGAEHYGLPASYPSLREVNVYLGWFGPLARPLQAGSFVGQFVMKVPGTRAAMRIAGEKTLGLVGGPEAGTTPDVRSWIAAEAYDGAGRLLADVQLAGVDGYAFTRVVPGVGGAAAGRGCRRARAGRGVRARAPGGGRKRGRPRPRPLAGAIRAGEGVASVSAVLGATCRGYEQQASREGSGSWDRSLAARRGRRDRAARPRDRAQGDRQGTGHGDTSDRS